MPHDVIMPALGMAQDTGKIVAWLKKPGDAVKTGDVIMEVETDKATMEVEAQADGFLAQVSAGDGDDVPVGQVVAIISETQSQLQSVADTSPGGNGDARPAGGKDAKRPLETGSLPENVLPPGEKIIMPALGMAQDTGLIVAWRKSPGDMISADDVLLEVETDKSTMEVPAGHDGFVAALLAQAQEAVPVGSVIAVISPDKPDNPVHRSSHEPAELGVDGSAADTGELYTAPAAGPHTAASGNRILASPKMRRLAREQGLDLARLVAEGVAQPYHVADLELLREFRDETQSSEIEAAVPAATSSSLHVAAHIETTGCERFIEWMKSDGGIEIAPHLLWLRFATSALREARGDGSIVVEFVTRQESNGRYVDADRSSLSHPVADEGDAAPTLVMRDLTGTAVSVATTSNPAAPVLSMGKQAGSLIVTLDYREDQLGESQAFELVDAFAERLADPLPHIV